MLQEPIKGFQNCFHIWFIEVLLITLIEHGKCRILIFMCEKRLGKFGHQKFEFSLKFAPTKFTRNAKITSDDLYLSRHNRRIGPKLKELFTFLH